MTTPDEKGKKKTKEKRQNEEVENNEKVEGSQYTFMSNWSSKENILKKIKYCVDVHIRETKNMSPVDLALREARSIENRHFVRLS